MLACDVLTFVSCSLRLWLVGSLQVDIVENERKPGMCRPSASYEDTDTCLLYIVQYRKKKKKWSNLVTSEIMRASVTHSDIFINTQWYLSAVIVKVLLSLFYLYDMYLYEKEVKAKLFVDFPCLFSVCFRQYIPNWGWYPIQSCWHERSMLAFLSTSVSVKTCRLPLRKL